MNMDDGTLDVDFINKSKIRPNVQRAKIAQIMIWVVTGVHVISIYSNYMYYNLLLKIQNGDFTTDGMLTSNDSRIAMIAILYSAVFIASAVTFIQWFRRAYYNLNIRTKCDHTEGWASGFWFIPIVSLFRPYQIMLEMWHKTTNLIKDKSTTY